MPQHAKVFIKMLLGVCIVFSIMWIISGTLPRTFSSDALAYFQSDFLERASYRANRAYVSTGARHLIVLVVLFWFVYSRQNAITSSSLRTFKGASTRKAFWIGASLALQTGLLIALVSLPFQLYTGYFLEKTFSLTNLTLARWFLEFLKTKMLDFLIYAMAGGFAAVLFVRYPGSWPYILTLAWFFSSIFFVYIYPSKIAPMFDDFVPLEDLTLLQEVNELTTKAGIETNEVMVMKASLKTVRANAYFTGVGKSKRVVLYDTLIATHSPEQIKLVLAHELGHWKHGHIVKSIAISAVGILIMSMLFSQISSLIERRICAERLKQVFLQFVLFVVVSSYLITPVASYLSRRNEIEADSFSLQITNDPDSFISAMIELAKSNLSDVEPPVFVRWFSRTHPTTLERIKMGEGWKLAQ